MAVLSVTKQYSVTLDNGTEFSVDYSGTVSNVGEVINREMAIPTSEVTLINIAAAVAAGTLTDLKFCFIKNFDATNFVRIRLEDTGGHTADLKLAPGESFDLFNTKINVSATGGAFASFSDIDTISAEADTASCIVGIFAGQPC